MVAVFIGAFASGILVGRVLLYRGLAIEVRSARLDQFFSASWAYSTSTLMFFPLASLLLVGITIGRESTIELIRSERVSGILFRTLATALVGGLLNGWVGWIAVRFKFPDVSYPAMTFVTSVLGLSLLTAQFNPSFFLTVLIGAGLSLIVSLRSAMEYRELVAQRSSRQRQYAMERRAADRE
jgi:hypothetical protein